MKGISAVLATVLIVVITVAIIGLAYGWATGVFQMAAGAGEAGVSDVSEDLQKSVQITAATCDITSGITITVKNTGTMDIAENELTAFLNNVQTTDIDFEDGIAEGASVEYSTGVAHLPGYYTIKVDAPAGSVEETVTCP